MEDDSSDLSSLSSSPPSPLSPLDYPSPVSSQEQDANGITVCISQKRKTDGTETPVPKKRRRAEPKPRTTEQLDLTGDSALFATEQSSQIETLLKVLRKRRKIVVIAGAGMSVSAGIPDFRSSTGLFKSLKSEHKLKASGKQLFDASVYQTDQSTSSFHDMVRSLSGLVGAAKPTAFHQMLSTLGQEGRLMRLYTQNVDGIDIALPSLETTVPLNPKGPWPRSIQLHGGLEKMVCTKCSTLSDFDAELFNGPEPPPCQACVEADRVRTDHAGKRSHGIGRLRPRIVLYNEHNPDEEAIGAAVASDLRSRPDAVIVVGTSMKIPGVKRIVREMCGVVRGRRDGLTIWMNHGPPPPGKEFEDCWDLVVKGPCDEVARQWKLSLDETKQCSESDIERAKDKKNVQVVIDSAGKTVLNPTQGILTPVASPGPKLSEPLKKIHIKLNLLNAGPKKVTAQKSTKKRPQPTKAKKPTKKESKPQAQSVRINNSFKLSKSVGRPTKKPSPPPSTGSRSISPSPITRPVVPALFPNLTSHPGRITLPPIPPSTPVRPDSLQLCKSNRSTPSSPLSSPPGSAGSWRNFNSGTISPTTAPKGMGHLLDWEDRRPSLGESA